MPSKLISQGVVIALTGLATLSLLAAGCAVGGPDPGSTGLPPADEPAPLAGTAHDSGTQLSGFGLPLPVDRPQPWDSEPLTSPLGSPDTRQTAGLNADSVFVLGNDYISAGGVFSTNLPPALSLDSAPVSESGGEQFSYSVYRLPMQGQEPGVVTVDANQNISALSLSGPDRKFEYWVGVSNYTEGVWQWNGPFAESHVRIPTSKLVRNGRSLLSGLGNTFVAVAVFGGPQIDVAGVGASPFDPADHAAPPAPMLSLQSIPGGVAVNVVSGVLPLDLAGYRVYYSKGDFSSTPTAPVYFLKSLEALPQCIVPGSGTLFVAVANMDISGNESPMSAVMSAPAGPGGLAELYLGASSSGGKIEDEIQLSVSADLPAGCQFQYDLDGDGTTDAVAAADSGEATLVADTTSIGIIRPRVRAVSDDGNGVLVAQGSLSLVISPYRPPLASLVADNLLIVKGSTGTVSPVEFDASGSSDPDGGALMFYFDWDGTGEFAGAYSNPLQTHTYHILGPHTCTVKVKNPQGLADTASVVIKVMSMQATRLNDQGLPVATLCSVASASGSLPPAIAYHDSTTDAILVQRAANGSGTSWTTPEVAVSDITLCRALSLVSYGSIYMLAYERLGRLYYTETPNGTYNWDTPVTVRSLPDNRDAGLSCRLLTLDGDPNIAFLEEETNGGNVAVKYVQTTDSQHANWLTPTTCAAGLPNEVLTQRNNIAAAVIGGNAAIVYSASGEVRYKRSFYFQNQTPLWPSTPTVLSVNSSGDGISLAPIQNYPAVVFNTGANGSFYTRAAEDGSWGEPVQVSNRNANASALHYVDRTPCVLLAESGVTGSCYFVLAKDELGAEWNFYTVVTDLAESKCATLASGANGLPMAAFTAIEPGGKNGVYSATLGF